MNCYFSEEFHCDCCRIIGFQPNTYTFTKALAENVINDSRHEIPVMIFRPAVGKHKGQQRIKLP